MRIKVIASATLPLFAFLMLFSASCVTQYSGVTEGKRSLKGHKWTLTEIPIRSQWRDEERQIPLLLAPYPFDAPQKFHLYHLPEVGNQSPQASGGSWAAGYFGTTYLFRIKKGIPDYTCSPSYLYNQLNGGQDRGVELPDLLYLLKNQGCAPLDTMPFVGYDYTSQPSAGAIQKAAHYRIAGYGRVDYTDLNQIKAHLLQDSVVIVTLQIYDNFINLDDEVWKSPVGNPKGRHTVALYGYDDTKELFYFQNSVGAKWGNGGRGAIPYSWLLRLATQCYVLW